MIRFAFPLFLAAVVAASPLVHAQSIQPLAPDRANTRHLSHAPRPPGNRDCLRSTGSLIPAKPGQCLPVAGRAYSQEDLRRTGAISSADALRTLEPGVH